MVGGLRAEAALAEELEGFSRSIHSIVERITNRPISIAYYINSVTLLVGLTLVKYSGVCGIFTKS